MPSSQYYFLIEALGPISFGEKPSLSFKEVRGYLELNLTPEDFEKVKRLLFLVDLYNIKALWLNLPFDERGMLSRRECEEALLEKVHLPPYVIDFLDRYESTKERLKFFSSLYVSFFQEKESGFLESYFALERETRLVLTALRAKQSQRDLLQELQFEDPQDPLVGQILSQKDSSEYTPPLEYEELKRLFEENQSKPDELNESFLRWKFRKVSEIKEQKVFSIDAVLRWIALFLIVDKEMRQDQEMGNKKVDELSNHES